jgi:uncharacterized damage-inducible protein DinB
LLEEIGKVYEYHDWANHQVLDAAETLTLSDQEADLGGSFPTFMKTLKHNLLVEALFIRRWQEQLPQTMPKSEMIGQMRAVWRSIETERNAFMAGLKEKDLSKTICYFDTRGRDVTLELWQAIFQCVNHSTHHRGQLIEKLRKLGKVPPVTDFVLFCRGIDK